MLNDIRPPKPRQPKMPEKEVIVPELPVQNKPIALNIAERQPIADDGIGLIKVPLRRRRKLAKIIVWCLITLTVVLIGVLASAWYWFNAQTSPISDDKQILIQVTIQPGSTPGEIGKLLANKSLIRNPIAFDVYTYLAGDRGKLQAGSYRLSPAESTQKIVEHLVSGNVYQFKISFLPGATLAQHKKVLLSAGFSEQPIDEAFAATYDLPLFKNKPTYTDLEGYIFGETYSFNEGASVQDILKRTFDQFYKEIEDNNLLAGFNNQGLNLYQAITLASIIQREASNPQDQKQVAQVFLYRLKIGMMLGSDVTYQYIADKLGVARDYNLDNPYNTRNHVGLPPSPIASPGLSALEAVASPASGDYVYFLAGDDGKMYFSHTDAEHEANKAKYCVVGCATS